MHPNSERIQAELKARGADGEVVELRVLIDSDLLQHGEIWAAAGTPRAVFRTTPDELIRLTGGEVVAVADLPEVTGTAEGK